VIFTLPTFNCFCITHYPPPPQKKRWLSQKCWNFFETITNYVLFFKCNSSDFNINKQIYLYLFFISISESKHNQLMTFLIVL
jgi:hypothetical protein